MTPLLGSLLSRLLGLKQVESIDAWDWAFAAPWAQRSPVLVWLLLIGVVVVGVVYYLRYQSVARKRGRILMTLCRCGALALLILILAEPSVKLSTTERPSPLVVALFDGSESMGITDSLSPEEREAFELLDGDDPTRLELVQRSLESGPAAKALETLGENTRIRAYLMSGSDTLRALDEGTNLATQVRADAAVTPLGNALQEIARRHKGPLLSSVVVFSDFQSNTGSDPLASARELGAPIQAVGLGPAKVVDLAVDLEAPLVLKQDEQASVKVHLRAAGLEGETVRVTLTARRLGSNEGETQAVGTPVAPPKTVILQDGAMEVDIAYKPASSGRFLLETELEPFANEVLTANNRARREITVQDDSLHLYFVEYEPTWEWRFVKEVFHRDPLIGKRGFRTFLRSADFKVRRENPLFVDQLVRPRAEFFDNDVILLSDVPSDMLSDRFQQNVEEYVKNFGGGLVIIAGPRFGLSAFEGTRLADMLPVVPRSGGRTKDGPFRLELTAAATANEFMNLGKDRRESDRAWRNLGRLPWYQPVQRPHPLATVLAEHPTDKCADGKTPQPIIATRRVGKGEVVYVGQNEMWRLRRKYGETYYRQFWGQLIYRLGLGRALGSQKRFDLTTDRDEYRAGEKVRVSVEAYSSDFEPLGADALDGRLIAPGEDGRPREQTLRLPLARGKALYESAIPVYASGAYRLLVKDPATNEETEVGFQVSDLSVERRDASRDRVLQERLAGETGGRSFELHELDELASAVEVPEITRTRTQVASLWNTWLMLGLVLLLLFAEWITRKVMNLR